MYGINPQMCIVNPLFHGRFYRPKTKVLCELVKINFWIFFRSGIRNKKYGKVGTFQVWIAFRFVELRTKNHIRGGEAFSAPPPLENRVKLSVTMKENLSCIQEYLHVSFKLNPNITFLIVNPFYNTTCLSSLVTFLYNTLLYKNGQDVLDKQNRRQVLTKYFN